MLWIIISVIVLGLIGYLLFAPMIIDIDNRKSLYMARFHRLFSIRLIPDEWPWKLEMRIMGFFKKVLDLEPGRGTARKKMEKKKAKKPARPPKITARQALAVLRSFKVKKFKLNLNLGDAALNGKYFPLFWLAGNLLERPIQTSFTGSSIVMIRIENSIGRMLFAFIRNRK